MAYRRKYSSSRARRPIRRTVRRTRPSTKYRKSRTTNRTYRKKTSRRSMISMMSTKKSDTMTSRAASGTNPAPDVATTQNNVSILGSTTDGLSAHVFLYSPSYRFLVANNAEFKSARTSTRPYYVGLNEYITYIPNDGSTWWHRRIVFAFKTPLGVSEAIRQSIGAQSGNGQTSYRQFRDLSGQTTGDYTTLNMQLRELLFVGSEGVDWQSTQTAKLDRSRVTVLSDRRTQISSGNAYSRPVRKKWWCSINKTVQYDDEENGISMNPSPLSVTSKPGIGNIYVADFFICPVNNQPGTTALSLSSNSTMYWHEK